MNNGPTAGSLDLFFKPSSSSPKAEVTSSTEDDVIVIDSETAPQMCDNAAQMDDVMVQCHGASDESSSVKKQKDKETVSVS